MSFEDIKNSINFAQQEEDILNFWKANGIFEKSIEEKENPASFVFYDGPPFATGLPHYGHLLAGIIKDIIPRYQSMLGKKVERRFGWDCHGLPVEMEIQDQLGLKSSLEIEKYGIGRFNEACRSIVLRYTSEWRKTIERMGRWVDFDKDYKTMNLNFMESVWWVFKTLYEKGFIYEGYKVLPYSWKAGTSLSNFEANLNYKDVQDPAITVKFRLLEEPNTYLLAWTTTPWTLIGNLALCINKDIDYVKVGDKDKEGDYLILSKNAFAKMHDLHGDSKKRASIPDSQKIEKYQLIDSKDLIDKAYEPLFDYEKNAPKRSTNNKKNAYRILTDDYVSDEDGVGIVHLAPAYGEDDYRVCRRHGIDVFAPVDNHGNFDSQIDFIAGVNIKNADKKIIKILKEKNLIFEQNTIQHSYPFCWRTDSPLIYKAMSTWFVQVEKIKEELIKNNQKIHWVPEHIKNGRMGKWLENARDWDIGRNRYWGTPLPIWKSKSGEIICIGSRQELEELTGEKYDDLHKHFMDEVIIKKDGIEYHRVSQVLDCWFESGSMPFAQNHYPFENKEFVENNFPADFIAEGLDQTRGWFYTLLTISTCLKNDIPFQNVIVNGLILAEDGRKMSKRLKNYPDPNDILNKYGADALRMYMISSAVVRGEYLKFSETGVKEVIKNIILPLWNSFSFFTSYANIDQWKYRKLEIHHLTNPLDRWILSYLEDLNRGISEAMNNYELQKSVPPVIQFIDRLTNWYIRLSRRRFWKSENDQDKEQAYFTLYTVLLKISKLIAPFMPFISEKIYRVLTLGKKKLSVHLEDYPRVDETYLNKKLVEEMEWTEKAVILGRSLRAQHKIKIRQPLQKMFIICKNKDKKEQLSEEVYQNIIKNELNVKEVYFSDEETKFVSLTAKANFKTLGKKLGKKMKLAASLIHQLEQKKLLELENCGKLDLQLADNGESEIITLTTDDVLFLRQEKKGVIIANEADLSVVFDTEINEDLMLEGMARDIVNRIQKERKELNLHYTDRIHVYLQGSDNIIKSAQKFKEYLCQENLIDDLNFTPVENMIKDEINNEIFEFKIRSAIKATNQ